PARVGHAFVPTITPSSTEFASGTRGPFFQYSIVSSAGAGHRDDGSNEEDVLVVDGHGNSRSSSTNSNNMWNWEVNEMLLKQIAKDKPFAAAHGHKEKVWKATGLKLSQISSFCNHGGVSSTAAGGNTYSLLLSI
ncbi:unnamed protein product, partial [Discosporangium mesarthrocarpum]